MSGPVDRRFDVAGAVGVLALVAILGASVYAFWPKKPSSLARIEAPGAGDARRLDRTLPADGETLTIAMTTLEPRRDDQSVTIVTAPPTKTFWGDVKAPAEPDRVGCRLARVTTLDIDGGTIAHLPGSLDDDAEDAGSGLAFDLARTGCSFRRSSDGSLRSVVIVTPDELTGDRDEAGDGLVGLAEGAWPVAIRVALRLASVPSPPEAVAPGARFSVDEDVVLDHFKTHRHVTYTLAAWTEAGARVEVDAVEEAPDQQFDPGAAAEEGFARMVTEQTGLPMAPPDLSGLLAVEHLHGARLHAKGTLEVTRGGTFPQGQLEVEASHDLSYVMSDAIRELNPRGAAETRLTGKSRHVFRYARGAVFH